MKDPRWNYLGIGLFIIWLLTSFVLRSNFDTKIRYLSDDYDRYVYFQRGLWLVNHQVPYRDSISEYPQIPTYLFGLIHVVTAGEPNESVAYWKYSSFFSLIMFIILWATIELLRKILPKGSYLPYLLLLPAPLYFSINRFDILPAYLTLLSLKMAQEERWNLAAMLLGVGSLTKWYPALLLPAFLLYYFQTTHRVPWRMALVFFVTCLLIVLPTLLSGGLDALAVPYRFHLERGIETVSLPTLLSKLLHSTLDVTIDQKALSLTFFLLQIAAVPVLIFVRMDSVDRLLNACLLIITAFVLFSRIYSPQWLLWILPFYILAAKNRIDVGLIMLYGVTTYLGFPIVWDYFGPESNAMVFMGLVNIIFLVVIIARTLDRIINPKTISIDQPVAG